VQAMLKVLKVLTGKSCSTRSGGSLGCGRWVLLEKVGEALAKVPQFLGQPRRTRRGWRSRSCVAGARCDEGGGDASV
jgi:hypothetical protein